MKIDDSVTEALVRIALDGAVMRQRAIANNLANANVPGYRPVRVDFESQLQAHRAQLLDRNLDDINSKMLEGVHPQVSVESDGADATVKIDAEMARLNKTVVYYEALLKAMGQSESITDMAIREGH